MIRTLKGFLAEEMGADDRQKKFWQRPILSCPISESEVSVTLPFFALLRFNWSAQHTISQINHVVGSLSTLGKRYEVI